LFKRGKPKKKQTRGKKGPAGTGKEAEEKGKNTIGTPGQFQNLDGSKTGKQRGSLAKELGKKGQRKRSNDSDSKMLENTAVLGEKVNKERGENKGLQ